MGAGIAEVAASHGHQVLLYDISAEALTRAIDGIHARLNCFYVDWVIKVCPLRGRQHYTIRRKQSTNVVLL